MLLWLPVADGLAVVEDVGIAVGVAVELDRNVGRSLWVEDVI